MDKLTLIVVLPLVFEFIFVGVLFSLFKLSEVDLARVERAKETEVTCGQIIFHVYKAGAYTILASARQDSALVASFQQEAAALPDLTKRLRSECSNSPEASHAADTVIIIVARIVQVLDEMASSPLPFSYVAHSNQFAYLSQRLFVEIADISRVEASVTSHLKSHTDWYTLILVALSCGLLVSVIISLLVMRFIHADLLSRIAVVTDNTGKVAEGKQLNQLVNGSDEIAQLDKFVHEMNLALKGAESQKRKFMSMLAHDMRAPLTNVALLLDGIAIGKYEDDSAVRRGKAKKFLLALERVNRMIEDFLTLEKLNASNMRLVNDESPASEPISVSELVREVVEILSLKAEQKHVVFDEQCDPNSVVLADRDQLRRVIMNLSENAVKHTPEHGTVLLKSAISDRNVVVEIIDEGPGVPGDAIDRIFDKYEQNTGVSSPASFGLGLAICRLIIERHHGKIAVRNRTDRSGAIFSFTLPAKVS